MNDYKDAIAWAVAAEIISGTTSGNSVILDPKGTATRAQVATVLQAFCENIAQ